MPQKCILSTNELMSCREHRYVRFVYSLLLYATICVYIFCYPMRSNTLCSIAYSYIYTIDNSYKKCVLHKMTATTTTPFLPARGYVNN